MEAQRESLQNWKATLAGLISRTEEEMRACIRNILNSEDENLVNPYVLKWVDVQNRLRRLLRVEDEVLLSLPDLENQLEIFYQELLRLPALLSTSLRAFFNSYHNTLSLVEKAIWTSRSTFLLL